MKKHLRIANKIATDNIGLLHHFVSMKCVGWRFGSREELTSELSVEYVKSIRKYIDKKPNIRLSTWVFNSLEWEVKKILKQRRIIRVPAFNQKTETIREKAIQALNIVHFHGREGQCEDPSLLRYDDISGIEQEELGVALNQAFESLYDRERLVICHRYGIGTEQLTLEQCGVILCITRERTRQIESRSLRRLAANDCKLLALFEEK